MAISVNLKELQQILKDFHTLTGASVCIFDANFKPLTAYPGDVSICQLVKSTAEGQKACEESDKQACKLCSRQKQTLSYVCHAGLTDTVTPILHKNNVIGYIMFGEIATSEYSKPETLKRIIANVRKYGHTEKEIVESFSKLTFLDERQFTAATNIIAACAGYIFLSDMIKLDNDLILSQVTAYLEENCAQDISIKDLEKHFFVTKNKLYSLFAKNYSMTPMKYLNSVRLNKAKKMLLTSVLSIAEISEQCGFSNYNYFISSFKTAFGDSPHKFRKNANYTMVGLS